MEGVVSDDVTALRTSAFKWGKERGSPRGAVADTRHSAGVRCHACPPRPRGNVSVMKGGA